MKLRLFYALLAAFVLYGMIVVPLHGTLVDDTYIHLVYARNLADLGELSFNEGDPTYGATSPLWVALLSLVRMAGGDLISWCGSLSMLFALGSIALLYRIALRLSGKASLAAAAALLLAAEAWVVRWSAVGMETSFAMFMVLLALDGSISAAGSRGRSALFGLLLLLAVLARPEAILLVPLALAAFALTGRLRSKGGLAWLAIFAPLYIVWLLVIERHTGTYLPLTAGAKQGRLDISTAMLSRALVPIKIWGATLTVPWIMILFSAIDGIRARRPLSIFAGDGEEGRPAILLLILWALALPVIYVVLDFHVLSRYLVPVTPAVIVLAYLGFDRSIGRIISGRGASRWALVAVTIIALLQNVLFYRAVVVEPTREFSRGLEEVLGEMGRWLDGNSASDALVAAPDIGAIGYYSGREILDLGGLITPEINDMRQTIDVERIIEEGLYLVFEPDYLLDRSEIPDRFAGEVIGGYRFIPVVRGEIGNLGIRKPETAFYVLYAIEKADR
jgi:4-amino-4-deoxy-L-arabinose transferase-like glycosyltransferase